MFGARRGERKERVSPLNDTGGLRFIPGTYSPCTKTTPPFRSGSFFTKGRASNTIFCLESVIETQNQLYVWGSPQVLALSDFLVL